MRNPAPPRARLCIWTGVDPEHELDFNRWYDREHMQERVAIPGFRSARRFRAIGESVRPWLALYDTDDLAVFSGEAYRRAFTNQTPWSLRNFERMRDTQRRIGELSLDLGEGEGGALALLVAPQGHGSPDKLRAALETAIGQDHIVRASAMQTDARLSTAIGAGSAPVPGDTLVVVEATHAQPALEQADWLAGELGLVAAEVHGFQLLWRLGA